MKFKISHEINYDYSEDVYVAPQKICLKPKNDQSQKLIDFNLEIAPTPSKVSEILDPYENSLTIILYSEKIKNLKINSESTVETLIDDPFDFILDTNSTKAPIKYSQSYTKILEPYLHPFTNNSDVKSFSDTLVQKSSMKLPDFIYDLNQAIFSDFTLLHRQSGDAWNPEKTLESKKGSCRDLVKLFIECCRLQGIASRFTSGYYLGDDTKTEKELHAWAEVYLEGSGWFGVDPANGLVTSNKHISIASGVNPKETLPISGDFYSNTAGSQMTYKVEIKVL